MARNLASVAGDPVALSQAGHLGDDEDGAVVSSDKVGQGWTCDFCVVTFYPSPGLSLSQVRQTHMNSAHKGVPKCA